MVGDARREIGDCPGMGDGEGLIKVCDRSVAGGGAVFYPAVGGLVRCPGDCGGT